jgi:two-component system CheB/CheR fusion protein
MSRNGNAPRGADRRLLAVQAVVTRSPEAGVDLAAMIEDELLAHAATRGEALTIEGPEISLKAARGRDDQPRCPRACNQCVKYVRLGRTVDEST